MKLVTITEARKRLGLLVNEAQRGETIEITRRGKVVARLVPPAPARNQIDFAKLKALTDTMPLQSESAGDFIRRMRDEDRY